MFYHCYTSKFNHESKNLVTNCQCCHHNAIEEHAIAFITAPRLHIWMNHSYPDLLWHYCCDSEHITGAIDGSASSVPKPKPKCLHIHLHQVQCHRVLLSQGQRLVINIWTTIPFNIINNIIQIGVYRWRRCCHYFITSLPPSFITSTLCDDRW